MSAITVEIKLMPRIAPQAMDFYTKQQKLPCSLRSIDTDWMVKYTKEVTLDGYETPSTICSIEASRLREETNWEIKADPEFGEMLIGSIICSEFPGDFWIGIYQRVRKLN